MKAWPFLLAILLLAVPAGAAEVIVTWAANQEQDLSGYRVHWGTKSGKYSQQVDVLCGPDRPDCSSKAIKGLVSGRRYFFMVTAVDQAGNESVWSKEVESVARVP